MSEISVVSPSKIIELHTLKLPTVSQQGMKALELINAQDLQFAALESALSADPMLTGIILKYANSPMYSKLASISNVRRAINLLGIDIVKSAIIICTMRSYCEPSNPGKELLWEKSIHFAMLTKLLARKAFRKCADSIELAAMMSQIGGLVLSTNFSDDYALVIEQAEKKNISIEDQEFEFFGLHRADVTDYALNKLRLPQDVIQSLNAFHLNNIPSAIDTHVDRYVVILKLAETLIENEMEDSESTHVEFLMKMLSIDKADLSTIVDAYQEQCEEGFAF